MGKTADAIAEGVSIASAAARLAVRNHILVETIAHDAPFDVARFAPFARETLVALADEQEAAADLATRQRKKAWGKYSDSDGTHDYRDRDMRNLRKRHRQYLGVAKELRRVRRRPARRARARSSRRGMPRGATSRRTCSGGCASRACVPTSIPTTTMMRAARMQSLRLVDLPRLAAHRRHVSDAESPPSPRVDGPGRADELRAGASAHRARARALHRVSGGGRGDLPRALHVPGRQAPVRAGRRGSETSARSSSSPIDSERLALIERDDVFVPPYEGAYGWLAMRVEADSGDWDLLTELLDTSYRQVALQRQLRALDGGRGRGIPPRFVLSEGVGYSGRWFARERNRAPVAQWIEHLTTDQKVGSSSLFGRTLC